ncbi:MAG: polysaccharide deacetylase family protein [Flavobacteriaceae bacterium]|nr:polysaccharide deacetylase family protein [Flavobacteriaceae bacterium]
MNKKLFLASIIRPFLNLIPSTNGIVVVTLHNIEERYYEWFEEFIAMIQNSYGFINPEDFNKEENSDGIKVLLTFDDGFFSNKIISEKILSKYGVKALFFITEGFVGLNENQAYDFASKNIYPNSLISKDKNKQQSMSWDDVKSLLVQGHSIGAHTKTHPKLIDLNKDELKDEVIMSSRRIENILNINIDAFAFPFGTPSVLTVEAVNLFKNNFKYVFSNVRGNVNSSPSNYFIFRQNIVPGEPMWLIKNIIEGKLDWKYINTQKIAQKLFSHL